MSNDSLDFGLLPFIQRALQFGSAVCLLEDTFGAGASERFAQDNGRDFDTLSADEPLHAFHDDARLGCDVLFLGRVGLLLSTIVAGRRMAAAFG